MVATIQQGARSGHAYRQSSLPSIGRISGTRDSPPPRTGRDGTAASGLNATGPYRTRRYCRQPKASARRRAEWAEWTCRVDAANHDRTVATSVSVLTMNRDNANWCSRAEENLAATAHEESKPASSMIRRTPLFQ